MQPNEFFLNSFENVYEHIIEMAHTIFSVRTCLIMSKRAIYEYTSVYSTEYTIHVCNDRPCQQKAEQNIFFSIESNKIKGKRTTEQKFHIIRKKIILLLSSFSFWPKTQLSFYVHLGFVFICHLAYISLLNRYVIQEVGFVCSCERMSYSLVAFDSMLKHFSFSYYTIQKPK